LISTSSFNIDRASAWSAAGGNGPGDAARTLEANPNIVRAQQASVSRFTFLPY